ncbi:hypothetical protein [Streptomyces sp. MMS24-I29]|uniref:hypothetical protein n=1 Tax=Streptomyces sp. MMS24-I29 TaxID=3351480 RepID=UPI003C7D075D
METSRTPEKTRKTKKTRKTALSVAALAEVGVLLTGCVGGGGPAAPGPSPTGTGITVSDQDLGEVLDEIMFQGGQHRSADGGACLTTAAKKAGLSQQALAQIVEKSGDGLGAVVDSLSELGEGDAQVLLSPQLRESFDACVDAELLPRKGAEGAEGAADRTYEALAATKPAGNPAEGPADLTPKFEIRADMAISSPTQLTGGVVSMFSSYARDDKQRQIYEVANECLAGAVFRAGFTQETLRFLAGGAPLGAGSIAEYLPVDEDRKIWRSAEFITALTDCTVNARTDAGEDGKSGGGRSN